MLARVALTAPQELGCLEQSVMFKDLEVQAQLQEVRGGCCRPHGRPCARGARVLLVRAGMAAGE